MRTQQQPRTQEIADLVASTLARTTGRRVAGCTKAIQADPDVVVAVLGLGDTELAA